MLNLPSRSDVTLIFPDLNGNEDCIGLTVCRVQQCFDRGLGFRFAGDTEFEILELEGHSG